MIIFTFSHIKKGIGMKSKFLFPHSFEKVGWILFIPSLIAGIISLFKTIEPEFLDVKVFAIAGGFLGSETFSIMKNNIFDEILGIVLIVSLVFIAFSREKHEDEMIMKLRLDSLMWATYLNYIILLLAIIFVYDLAFFTVMIFNMFTILLFFTIKFKMALYQLKKEA